MKTCLAIVVYLGLALFGAFAARPSSAGVDGHMQVGLRIRGAAEAQPTYRQSVQRALIDSGTPRNVVLGALICAPLAHGNAAEVDARVARNAALASDDVLVQWLAANRLLSAHDAHAASAIDRLTRIEPGNASAWALALSSAADRGDRAGVDDALAHMAAATRADEHTADALRAWLAIYEQHRRPSTAFVTPAEADAAPFVEAMSAAVALATPSYRPFVEACADSSDAAHARVCAGAARVLSMRAMSLSARSIGFAVLRRLGDGHVAPADRAAERDVEWLIANARRASGFADLDRSAMDAERDDWRSLDDETEIVRRALVRMNLPVRAPLDWAPLATIARADAG